MRPYRRLVLGLPFLLLVLVLAVPLAAACGDESDSEGNEAPDPEADPDPEAKSTLVAGESVDVVLTDFGVRPAGAVFAAGAIRFAARNEGKITHELVICARSCEAGEEAELAEVEDIEAGDDGAFTIKLEPGEYELACLIDENGADHYKNGMRTKITVR